MRRFECHCVFTLHDSSKKKSDLAVKPVWFGSSPRGEKELHRRSRVFTFSGIDPQPCMHCKFIVEALGLSDLAEERPAKRQWKRPQKRTIGTREKRFQWPLKQGLKKWSKHGDGKETSIVPHSSLYRFCENARNSTTEHTARPQSTLHAPRASEDWDRHLNSIWEWTEKGQGKAKTVNKKEH